MTFAIHVAMADPFDRDRVVGQRDHVIADRQVLHRDLAALGKDARAGTVAGDLQIAGLQRDRVVGSIVIDANRRSG